MPAYGPGDGVVLVTGATGFVAAHVIQQLQRKGYRVRGTVRSLTKDPVIIDALRKLTPDARYPLELVEADLTNPGSWDSALAGCVAVFHIATVVVMSSRDPENDIIKPSVEGVKNVFEAARRCKTVKKIVLTSSVAAIYHAAVPGKVYTEEDWNTESTVKSGPYPVGKVRAEKWAWDFVKNLPEAEKIELEVINPALILGPMILNKEAPSMQVIGRILSGDFPSIPRFGFGVVDVRDVAAAHIAAYERNGSGNRYICVSSSMWMVDMAKALKKADPTRPIPVTNGSFLFFFVVFLLSPSLSIQFFLKSWNRMFICDNSRSRNVLGMQYRSAEEAVLTAGDSLVRYHWVPSTEEAKAKASRKKTILYSVGVLVVGIAAAYVFMKR